MYIHIQIHIHRFPVHRFPHSIHITIFHIVVTMLCYIIIEINPAEKCIWQTKTKKKIIKTIRSCFHTKHSTLFEFINRSPKFFLYIFTRLYILPIGILNQIQYNHKYYSEFKRYYGIAQILIPMLRSAGHWASITIVNNVV